MSVPVARAAALAAAVALAWAILVAWNGGIRQHLGPVVISSRDWGRSAAAAALCFAVSLFVDWRAGRTRASSSWVWVLALLEKCSAIVALGAAAAVFAFGLHYGARVAGGADSLGYVSQSYLWLKGDLEIKQPLAPLHPWPFTDESLAPLGYKPGATRHTSVPTYAPGLPMIMAGTLKTCGPCGPFYVGPLFAGLLVVSTWLLAYRVSRDGLTSALAALWMAASPTLLFNLVVPMSDLVAAALWIASFVLLTWPKPWHGAAAGIVAGAAVLVRPNLVPLLVPGVLAAELWKAGARPGRRTLAFLLTVLPAIVLVGLVNNRLYGSATLSGYGPTADLYALGRLPQNLLLYTTWLIESQGFIVLVALMPLVVRRARPAWLTPARTLPLAIYVVLLTLSYLFYLTFDAWWFLRFLLPAFPILFLLVGAALAWLTRQLPAVVGVPTLIAVVTILLARTVEFSLEKGVRGVGDGEERYSTIARFIDRTLPPNAAIIAMQHTGTIAFYSGRQTIRRDYLPRQRLRSIVDWLQANGYSPYIVLEDWEEAEFRRYFTDGQDSLSRLEVRVVAETMKPHVRVRIYDPQVPGDPNVLPLMLPVTHTGTCPDGRGQWAR